MVVVCIRVGWGLDLRIGVYFFVFSNKDYYYSKKKSSLLTDDTLSIVSNMSFPSAVNSH